MELKKYERWPYAFLDKRGNIWQRGKTKGWFEITFGVRGRPGFCVYSKYLTHPDFLWCEKILSKKDFEARGLREIHNTMQPVAGNY